MMPPHNRIDYSLVALCLPCVLPLTFQMTVIIFKRFQNKLTCFVHREHWRDIPSGIFERVLIFSFWLGFSSYMMDSMTSGVSLPS